jgi:hypothetical protein
MAWCLLIKHGDNLILFKKLEWEKDNENKDTAKHDVNKDEGVSGKRG